MGWPPAFSRGVNSIHDLHVWSLSGQRLALSAHVGLVDMDQWAALLPLLRVLLKDRFGIEHATLQPEGSEQVEGCLRP
jgi:cobalt-zinc-cadmium efflux system protein